MHRIIQLALKGCRSTTRTANASGRIQTVDRGRQINLASDKLIGRYLSFGAGRPENKAQGNVFKGVQLTHPGAPSVLTRAFCAVQLPHGYRLILSFHLFLPTPLMTRNLHKQHNTPPTQRYHGTPKRPHTA